MNARSARAFFKQSESLLPFSTSYEKSSFRIRSCFSHGLYRRVLLWSVISLVLITVILYSTHDVNVYDAAVHRWGTHMHDPYHEAETKPEGGDETRIAENNPDDEARRRFEEDVKKMPWLRFKQYVPSQATLPCLLHANYKPASMATTTVSRALFPKPSTFPSTLTSPTRLLYRRRPLSSRFLSPSRTVPSMLRHSTPLATMCEHAT